MHGVFVRRVSQGCTSRDALAADGDTPSVGFEVRGENARRRPLVAKSNESSVSSVGLLRVRLCGEFIDHQAAGFVDYEALGLGACACPALDRRQNRWSILGANHLPQALDLFLENEMFRSETSSHFPRQALSFLK
jgi:hypothetical protein